MKKKKIVLRNSMEFLFANCRLHFTVLIVLLFQVIGIKSYGQENPKITKLDNQYFIENKGQWDDEVLFLTKQNGMNAWITKHGITYDFYKITEKLQEEDKRLAISEKNQQLDKFIEGHVVRINLVQPSPQLKTEGSKKLKAYENYFIGNDKTKWQSNVGLFEEAVIKNNIQLIDSRYYFDQQQLRYDYIVQPNANPSDIQFTIEGSSKNYINSKGELVFTTQFGEVKQGELFTYQIIDGVKTKIASQFKSIEGGRFGFHVGNYDKRFPLIIDPILYATYYGGLLQESASLKVINPSEIAIAGSTNSATLPVITGPYGYNLQKDIFIAKFNPTLPGSAGLIYTTYLGGDGNDYFGDFDIESTGEISLTGSTNSTNYPNISGIPNQLQGGIDLILSVFNNNGSALIYSTVMGGIGLEQGNSIYVKNSIATIAGVTYSPDWPITSNAISNSLNGNSDILVLEINTSLSGVNSIQYSSYFGGNNYEEAYKVSKNNLGKICIAGVTQSNNFPCTTNAFDQSFNGGYDALYTVINVNNTSTNVEYSTYFGGAGDEYFLGLDINNANQANLCGITSSSNFPTTTNSYDNSYNGAQDGTVTIIDPAISGLSGAIYSSYIGTIGDETLRDIKLDHCNTLLLGGNTNSSTFPLQNPEFSQFGGQIDGVLLRLNPTLGPLGIIYSTLLPGNGDELVGSVDFDNLNGIYIGGRTTSTNFSPVLNSSILPYSSTNSGQGTGSNDAFLVKMEICSGFNPSASYNAGFSNCGLSLFATGGVSYSWTGPGGFSSSQQNPVIPNYITGIYSVIISFGNCCQKIDLNVTPVNPFITASNSTPCAGNELVAHPPSSIGSSSYTYSWQGPIGSNITNPTFQVIGANATGIYTVTVTNASGCSATATFNVLPLPTILSLTTSTNAQNSICPNSQVTLNAIGAGGTQPYSYTWANSINTTILTGNTVTVSPAVTTTYTVTITDANGCSGIQTITLNVLPSSFCCSPEASNVINNVNTILLDNKPSSYLVSLNSNNSTIQNKTLFVNGTFTIDQSVTLGTNLHVYFTPNSKIIIQPNKFLELNNAGLNSPMGCDMWDGIYASSPTAELRIQNSTLRDMINGLVISNNAFLSVTNSTFSDNRQSIYLSNCNLTTSCIVKGNLFNRITNLHAPFVAEIKPRWGMYISKCNNLLIGDNLNAANGNTFEGLWCGIYVENGAAATVTNPVINLYNNKFRNISAGIWGSQITTSTKGWGVYAYNGNSSINFRVNVYGSNTSTTDHFFRCDKGILLRRTGGVISENKFENTTLGMLMTECPGRTFSVHNNVLNNSEIGICKIGDESTLGFNVQLNTINLADVANTQLVSGVDVPTGIMSSYSSFNNIGRTHIQSNTINMPLNDEGIGISLSQGSRDYIQGNIIHLTGTSGSTNFNIPRLMGIYSNTSIDCSILNNLVDNNNSVNGSTTFVPGNNAGIFTIYNLNSTIKCNTLSYLQNAFLAVGPNGSQSNYDQTSGNVMLASAADFLFWELALDGTFGQVGLSDPLNNFFYDANNIFLGPTTLNRVCRVTNCPGNFYDKIVTTPAKLTQQQSIATNTNSFDCLLKVTNLTNFTQTYMCSSSGTPSEEETLNLDYQYALLVASESLVYDDFEAGTKHLNEGMLLNWLRENQMALNENPVLNSFYLDRASALVGQLEEIDFEIAMLADSVLVTDTLAREEKMNMIVNLNNQINSTEIFAVNAKLINDYYIKAMRLGIESINSTALEEITEIAETCPLVGGNAVYRARTLLGLLGEIKHYDDLVICNGQGVYKNGISKLQEQINGIQQQMQHAAILDGEVLVYPVPAGNTITIEYKFKDGETAQFYLYDIFGNKVVSTSLNSQNLKTIIDIHGLAQGLYTYQVINSNSIHYYGKVIKE